MMLNTRTLSWLLILVVSIAAAGFWLVNKTDSLVVLKQGELLTPGLDPKKINTVTIKDSHTFLSFHRDTAGWQIMQKYGYRVVPEKVEALLYSIADLKVIEPKTTNDSYYPLLDVADIGTSESNGVLITALDEDGHEVLSIILGKKDAMHLFVRNKDDEQTWLVQGFVDLSIRLKDWVRQPLLQIADEDQIMRVAVARDPKEPIVFQRNALNHEDFMLQDLKDVDPTNVDPNSVNLVPYEIAEIEYLDVFRREDKDIDWQDQIRVDITTADAKFLHIDVVRYEDQIFARLSNEPEWYFQLSERAYTLLSIDREEFIIE